MERKKLINKKKEILKKFQQEKNIQAKRMKKTVPTIFVTDAAKDNTSLIKTREVRKNSKKSCRKIRSRNLQKTNYKHFTKGVKQNAKNKR